MSKATRFDLTREEIIERYRQRIARGDRTQMPKDELGQLIIPAQSGFYMLNQIMCMYTHT